MDTPKENNDASIQLSKKPMNEKALAGLAAGRAKLQELNKAKADAKSVMLREAIAKKAARSAERDAKLLKEIDLAIAELSEGEEEAPGRAPVPGVMERLNKLDGELSNNGGSTTKDKVDQLYDNQAIFMKSVSQRLSAIENCLTVTPTNGSKQEKI